MRRLVLALALGGAFALPFTLSAQSKPPVTRADYGQFETVSLPGGRGGGNAFSPNGQWLAYALARSSRSNELRLIRLSDQTTRTIPFGTQATFSSDSKWAAYSIGVSEAETERLRTANRPVQNSLGLLDLTSGETSTVEGVESFSLSADGQFIALRRYAPSAAGATGAGAEGAGGARGAGGGRGANAETDPIGTTLIVRNLATGRDTTFGNVSAVEWQDHDGSHLLALTISADGKTGNGVHLFDPATAVLRVLDSSATTYSSLTWRADSSDLVVLKAKSDSTHDGSTYSILEWTNTGSANEKLHTYDPTTDTSFPKGMRTTTFRRPSWIEDGSIVLIGIGAWDTKPAGARGAEGAEGAASAADAATAGQGAPARGARGRGASAAEVDEPAGVDIWHWTDVDVMAKQKLSATADRRRTYLAAWQVNKGTLAPIGKSFTEQVTPLRHQPLAYVAEWSTYAMDRSIGRPAADLYLADLKTGTRTKIKDNVIDRYAQISPGGKYLLYVQDDQYWTMNVATKAVMNITKGVATSFIDKESDDTIKQKPPFGVAGWTKDDASVVLNDKFDLWQVAADGSRATKLTNGAADEVRHRYLRLGQDEETIDLTKPIYVSLFGMWSKKSGYGRVMPGNTQVERAIWLDKSVASLTKAKDADVFAYVAQDYDDSPDIFVGSAGIAGAKQITTTNPFQANYAWGRSEIVEYKTDKGQRLQGALYYPAGYEAGKRYPMIVYLYERLSDNVHRYVAPSDRDYYNTSVFTSQGYFVLQPDIVFRPRDPGLSVVECVTPAVRKVVQMGVVDGARVGVIGHSWGGFDTAFLATHTTGVFAAAVAGAPITDLVSNYGNHHWSSGIAETDHIETGQQRMEVPLYEDLPAYVRNSAVFNAQNMTVPLLIEVGDADGTVFWHQGVELYNIARRAKKNVVMLVYNGEDHGLRQKKNQVDYQHRILEWFGYYLKSDAPASWVTSGETAIQRADEVKAQTIRKP